MEVVSLNLANQFHKVFSGLDRAYGIYQIDSQKANGKNIGKAATVKLDVTEKIWQDHLNGKKGIGIIPIKDNSCCNFGAIDIDVYANLDFNNITKQIEKNNFPLVPCRSKSGGCHLYLFVKEEVSATLLVEKLKEMAAVLGFGNCETYPRATKILAERGDMGQWINMPYFNGVKGLRYAIDPNGAPVSPEKFLLLVQEKQVTKKQLSNIHVAMEPVLANGPPCLQYLITQGFPEGTRNDGLFNLGVYLVRAYPDDWQDKLEDYNRKYMDPPLKAIEIQGILKSLNKKEYFYTCTKAPLVAYCNKALCMTREFGIGATGLPVLSSLTKYDCVPPIWFVNVDGGGRLELITEDIQNQLRFQKRCIECLNIMPPTVGKNQWQQLVQKLLDQVIVIEAPADASPVGQLIEYLEKFCTSRVQAQNKDELLLGKPYAEDGNYFFRMSDFMAYLERNHFREFKVNKITSIIREQLHAEHHFFSLKGKGINVWSIPEFQHQTEAHDIPDFEDNTYY